MSTTILSRPSSHQGQGLGLGLGLGLAPALSPGQRPLAFAKAATVVMPDVWPVSAAEQAERIVFWDIPASPFCVKVRALLRFKGLVFEAQDPLAPGQWQALRKRGHGVVPAVEIDGRFVADSSAIAWELDRLYPHPQLIPGAPRARALCHALEAWADEALHFDALHLLWQDKCRAGRLTSRLTANLTALFGRGLLGRLTDAAYRWRHGLHQQGRSSRGRTPADAETAMQRHLTKASALLVDAPFLLGDRPWLCDFALYGQLSFLLRTRRTGDMVRQAPGLMDYIERVRGFAVP